MLVGDAGPVPQEGTLLPETYLFTRGETRAHLLAKMARGAGHVPGRAMGQAAPPACRWPSMREAMILASIVEKETGAAGGAPPCRRRLRQPAEDRHAAADRSHHHLWPDQGLSAGPRHPRTASWQRATPYNTYVIAGLPPGPICNPGKDSIAAVLNPETSDDLYFVATGHGGHAFAATMAEQARNVAAYRAFERQNRRRWPGACRPGRRQRPAGKSGHPGSRCGGAQAAGARTRNARRRHR